MAWCGVVTSLEEVAQFDGSPWVAAGTEGAEVDEHLPKRVVGPVERARYHHPAGPQRPSGSVEDVGNDRLGHERQGDPDGVEVGDVLELCCVLQPYLHSVVEPFVVDVASGELERRLEQVDADYVEVREGPGHRDREPPGAGADIEEPPTLAV